MAERLLCVVKNSADLGDIPAACGEWEAVTAADCGQAQSLLATQPFDVILVEATALTGPHQNFLTRVMTEQPNVTRIALFDAADKRQIIRTDGGAQQCVARPCSADTLGSAVKRARLLNTWLSTPGVQRLFPQMKKLPSVPSVYFRLLREMESPDAGIEDIGKIIAQDLALTAKVLQLVNSAVFGLGREITHPMEAVSYLGLDRTKSLVLLAHTFANVESGSLLFSLEQLWHHSMLTAQFAQWITREETGDRKQADEAYTAAMLHDMGKLMLGINVPRSFTIAVDQAQQSNLPLHRAEREVLGTTHAELGACMLGIWGLPSDIIEAIAYHHEPAKRPGEQYNLVTAVHVANVIEHQLQQREATTQEFDQAYLERLGIQDHPDSWRQLCSQQI